MQLQPINLFMIGLPRTYHSTKPRAGLYPEKLNPTAREYWERLFKNELITKSMDDIPSTGKKWDYMFHLFMQKCRDHKLSPFSESVGTQNQKIIKFLINARRQIAAFLSDFGLFSQFKICKVTREFRLKDNGIDVFSSCKLRGVTDKAAFIEHITNLRFKKALGGNRYSAILNGFMFVHLTIHSNTDVTLCYEIRCPLMPNPHYRNRVITDKDFKRFLANQVWLPVVRTVRFPKAIRPTLF